MVTNGGGDDDDLVRDVGRRIAEVRAAKGLTQEKFSEALGIELRNVQRLEGGRANITLTTLGRVARALGVRPIDLLESPISRAAIRGRPRRSRDRGGTSTSSAPVIPREAQGHISRDTIASEEGVDDASAGPAEREVASEEHGE